MNTAMALAPGASFEFDGVVYAVPPAVYAVQAEFEKYFTAQAYSNLQRDRKSLGSDYESERSALRRDIDAGLYNWESDLVREALRSTRHYKHMTYLCLAYGNKDKAVPKDLVDRIEKAGRAADLMAAVEQANTDPNPPGPPTDLAK